MKQLRPYLLIILLLALFPGCQRGAESPLKEINQDSSLERVKKAGVLLWGADVVGGIPYVYEDPNNKGSYVGFEMDIAKAIASHMGVEVRLVIRAWDTLIPELQKGSFDMAMNGIEDTEDRGKIVSFSNPYYLYSQQITVRKKTMGISSLDNLKGRKVATLSGTAAEDILRQTGGIHVVTNPEIIYSYKDLEDKKVDAVLLDTPIAAAYGATNPMLKNVGESFGEGRYVIAFRNDDKTLLDAVNQALTELKDNGELKSIYTRWGIMDKHQENIGIK